MWYETKGPMDFYGYQQRKKETFLTIFHVSNVLCSGRYAKAKI